jgi:phage repressor protein C with HTH and peptisase S24 domain
VYSLVAAGGPLKDNPELRLVGRVYAPERVRTITPNDFIGQIEGFSMDRRIPDGSYLLLRWNVVGSRSGRTVLVEERKIAECAYTLKMYLRIRGKNGEPDRIVLRSSNPDHPDIEINEGGESQDQRYAVIAEFVTVLEGPLRPVEREEWQEPA